MSLLLDSRAFKYSETRSKIDPFSLMPRPESDPAYVRRLRSLWYCNLVCDDPLSARRMYEELPASAVYEALLFAQIQSRQEAALWKA